MRKTLIAGILVTTTMMVSGAAFAEPFPGRQPPCSIIRKSPLEQGVGTALCTHPASNPLTPLR